MYPKTAEENLMTMTLLATIVMIAFVCFVILLAYLFTTRKNKLIQEKNIMKSQFEQELLQTQLEIKEQIMKNISEEIHDNVGQVLSLVKLNLNTIGNINNEPAQSKINNTKELVGKVISDLRDLSRSLHGEKIGEIGLQNAIYNELKIIQNTGQFHTDLEITGHIYKMDAQKEIVLFRIIQESLHNAVKHARSNQIKVSMHYNVTSFLLSIEDNGMGFDQEDLDKSTIGMGLKNMENRALLIGAVFSIVSEKNKGTTINIRLDNPRQL